VASSGASTSGVSLHAVIQATKLSYSCDTGRARKLPEAMGAQALETLASQAPRHEAPRRPRRSHVRLEKDRAGVSGRQRNVAGGRTGPSSSWTWTLLLVLISLLVFEVDSLHACQSAFNIARRVTCGADDSLSRHAHIGCLRFFRRIGEMSVAAFLSFSRIR
jgi:hypothetical protein